MARIFDRIGARTIVDSAGRAAQWFDRQLDKAFTQLESSLDGIRRNLSHTVPTTILSATEDGVDVTIEILAHQRVYADLTTVSLTGSTVTGLLPDTLYGCYYDDATFADPTPTFHFTTDMASAQAIAAPFRHWCGAILTPELASGKTIESGGAYPAGSSIGGELY